MHLRIATNDDIDIMKMRFDLRGEIIALDDDPLIWLVKESGT